MQRAVDFLSNHPELSRRVHGDTPIPASLLSTGSLTSIPDHTRLALEMALHEGDERCALDGEMAALELRWREAEEIAHIADGLLTPDALEVRLLELRSKASQSPRSRGSTVAGCKSR